MTNTNTIEWTDEVIDLMIDLKDNQDLTFPEVHAALEEHTGKDINFNTMRTRCTRERVKRQLQLIDGGAASQSTSQLTSNADNVSPVKKKEPNFKETVEIHKDGTQSSQSLIEMSEADKKDPGYLLQAHGYDPVKWELSGAKNSKWNHHNKRDGTIELYASSITVKPADVNLDVKAILDYVNNVRPVTFKRPSEVSSFNAYAIPLYDMHFGINTYEDYEQTLMLTVAQLQEKVYEAVLITIGSDLFHHNDHRNRTASSREIEHADMTQAWSDAQDFYDTLIRESLQNSKEVSIYYVKGNHDETLSWAFAKMLEAKYPQVTFDTDFEERKVALLGTNFIGLTHGDKSSKKRYPSLFATEFPTEWAQATNRDLFTGHLHHEHTIDDGGIAIRQTSTGAKVDAWHKDNGYTMAHKRFSTYLYSSNQLENIRYV